jgi:transcriptional regulator with XRE-family HTH domain
MLNIFASKGLTQMNKLTDWLRAKRLKSKLDVRELSAQSFVATSQISRIENNLSAITINTLVGLGYGLDFGLKEVMDELEIRPYFPKLRNRKINRDANMQIPQISDAYSMWLFYRDEPQRAKGLMYDGYHQVREQIGNENGTDLQKSFDMVWEALQDSDEFSALPYPPEIKLDHFLEIYSNNGAITNKDLGISLAMRRAENNLSQRELAKKTKISHSVISRLERGFIDRVFFDYVVTLDNVLVMDGELIAFAWAAGEYQSGISLLKYLNEKELELRKLHYTNWDSSAKAWVDTFIAICRWHHVKGLPPSWWLSVQRAIDFYKK